MWLERSQIRCVCELRTRMLTFLHLYLWILYLQACVMSCVCVSSCREQEVCVCFPCVNRSATTYQPKQTPQHFSWAWNLSPWRKSLSLVLVDPSESLCQQYSSFQRAAAHIWISSGVEKRENTSVSVSTSLVHSERSFRWTLLLVVSQVRTHTDCKWAEITPQGMVWVCRQRHRQTHTLEYRRNNYGKIMFNHDS